MYYNLEIPMKMTNASIISAVNDWLYKNEIEPLNLITYRNICECDIENQKIIFTMQDNKIKRVRFIPLYFQDYLNYNY